MAKIRFKVGCEWREVEIQNDYEMRTDRFGGIDIIANDGKISIEPCMSNNITIKTV